MPKVFRTADNNLAYVWDRKPPKSTWKPTRTRPKVPHHNDLGQQEHRAIRRMLEDEVMFHRRQKRGDNLK